MNQIRRTFLSSRGKRQNFESFGISRQVHDKAFARKQEEDEERARLCEELDRMEQLEMHNARTSEVPEDRRDGEAVTMISQMTVANRPTCDSRKLSSAEVCQLAQGGGGGQDDICG